MKKTKSIKKLIFPFLAIGSFLYYQNNHLSTSYYKFNDKKIKENMRILHISDTHNKKFAFDNLYFIDKIRDLKPDIIIHTGDAIGKFTNVENTFKLMEQLSLICPVYFIQGNHDLHDSSYKYLKNRLENLGIHILENESLLLSNNINLIGLKNNLTMNKRFLKGYTFNKDYYNICLIHKPLNFKELKNKNFDLFLAGHTHGGQWIIPFKGGLFIPKEGFFPYPSSGLLYFNDTPGIINRGIGGPLLIPRLNNYPEIVILDLSST